MIVVALSVSAVGLSGALPTPRPFEHLEVRNDEVHVINRTPMIVRGPAGLRLIGPYDLKKVTDRGLEFEVSLASFVGNDVVVSIPAERLLGSTRLNYGHLPRAVWPDPSFGVQTSTCIAMTREQAASLPRETGIGWVLDAGFNPDGYFAVESVIKSSADGIDEVSIEIIARVDGCGDRATLEQALSRVRSQLQVVSPR